MVDHQGTDAPTLVEVARVAGVSRATASRAINGGARVSPDAMAAVEAAVRETGYRPNRAARSLVTRRTDSIAVVIPESDRTLFADPFFATILHGVTSALSSTDLQIVLLLGEKGSGGNGLTGYLRGGHWDGAIVVSHHRDDGVAEVLAASAMPSVFIGRPWSCEETPVSFIDVDNRAGGRLAADYLVGRGARRPATIAGPLDMGASVDRLAGWRDGLRAAGLDDSIIVHGNYLPSATEPATRELLAAHPDVDAIFVASDLMGGAVLRVLREHGRRVPEDVLVVGFDDMEIARTTEPPLTTVVNPAARMAREAVEMLLEKLVAMPGAGCASRVLTTELVVRDSA